MAAIASKKSCLPKPGVPGYAKTTRRQYQSCDQCRKARRACDASTLRVANYPLDHDESLGSPASTCESCSNCARTSKKCTFGWLSSVPDEVLPKGTKRKLELTSFPHATTVAQTDSGHDTNPKLSYTTSSAISNDVPPSLESAMSLNGSLPAGSCHGQQERLPGDQHLPYPRATPSARGLIGATELLPHSHSTWGGIIIAPAPQPTGLASVAPSVTWKEEMVGDKSCALAPASYDTSSSSSDSVDHQNPNSQGPPFQYISPTRSDASFGNSCNESPPHKQPRYLGPFTDSSDASSSYQGSLFSRSSRGPSTSSSYSSNSRGKTTTPIGTYQLSFADSSMKTMLAGRLRQIYHDTFENSLLCWVTEQNCPYETELADLIKQSRPRSRAEEVAVRLSDDRVFSRVSRLDSAFAPLRDRPLSALDNQIASRALQTAIMAFASQWSHASHNSFWRSQECRSQIKAWGSQLKIPFPSSDDSDEFIHYERIIRKHLWHEARTAIRASAEIDSFKVILAYMIFALTQRPVDQSRTSNPEPKHSGTTSGPRPNDHYESWNPSMSEAAHVQYADPAMESVLNEEWNPFYASDLDTLESPPIYLETAVRNLFSWRRKVERYRRIQSQARQGGAHGSMSSLALKDQQTFNILFWLGVMCDTTSSAVSKRPLVIPDEDCGLIREKLDALTVRSEGSPKPSDVDSDPMSPDEQEDSGATPLWGSYLLNFQWAGPRTSPPRWPCKFEEAALVLQEAIPVKVLMFRKVGQLQTLAYRRSPPRKLENRIQEALAVYSRWNATYGQFMTDCVGQHNTLPPQVQSWYVILGGHWHYGCLLLADTILQVDKEEKTMSQQRKLRASCGLVTELRMDNAYAISKIAQASLSEHAPSFPDNLEFQFACNGTAILTEPWTDILVRALGSACKIFINWLSSWDNKADPLHDWVIAHSDYDEIYLHAEFCIQGMTLLGRKSDAANYTAEVFQTRLNQVCSKRRLSNTLTNETPLAEQLLSALPDLDFLSSQDPVLMAV